MADFPQGWTPVELPDSVWLAAIGDEERSEEALENAEMGPCCGNIRQIRNLLFKVQQMRGADRALRQRLQEALQSHEPVVGERDNLNRILCLLGLSWSD